MKSTRLGPVLNAASFEIRIEVFSEIRESRLSAPLSLETYSRTMKIWVLRIWRRL